MPVADIIEIVIVRILGHSSIEVRPSQDILGYMLSVTIQPVPKRNIAYHSVLFVFNSSHSNLG